MIQIHASRVARRFYIYLYLDKRRKGSYSYGGIHFEYEPFYVVKVTNDRYLNHLRVNKIKSILNDGFEPKIIKIF